jgi:outer membrane protein OmpA-like peptidoglycan-associated protein
MADVETPMSAALTLPPRDRDIAWGTLSLLLSIILHALLALWFWGTSFQQMAIPTQKIPIQLKRIELPSPALQELAASTTLSIKAPQTLEPPPQLPLLKETLEKNLQVNAPAIALPSAPQVEIAQSVQFSPSAAALSTPYKPADTAQVQAEILKFQIGPPSVGAPVISTQNLTSNAQGIGNTPSIGGLPGMTSHTNPPLPIPLPTTQAPTFDALSATFQDPNASARLKLPQPVLLRFPSDILFEFDVSTLKPQGAQLLEQAIPFIQKFPVAQIMVEGHTDSYGADDYNQKLSEARAKSVEEWFRKNLQLQYQVQSRGYGKTRPIVSPTGGIQEQAKNRRVEIIIQGLQP